MTNSSTKLRFAVLVEGHLLKKWQIDCIQDLLDSGLTDCVQIIENKGEESYKSISLSLGYRFIDRLTRNSGPLTVIDISKRFEGVERISIQATKKGYAHYFSPEDLDDLKELKLDFVLRFGFGILKGDVLSLPRYGVWSFHHGDPLKYRGGPAGFWEIYDKNPITGSMLQRIGEKLDQGELLKVGHYQTINHSYRANLHHILGASKTWPTLVVKQIIHQGKLSATPIRSKAKIYKTPTTWQAVLFLGRIITNKIKFHREQLFKAEKWNVGVVDQKIEHILDEELQNIQWLKDAPRHEYYADPFALSEDQIAMEVFSYKTNKAVIEKTKAGEQPTPLLSKRTHLSYPYTISSQGKTYLLPENYRNPFLSLYELEEGKVVNEIGILKGNWIDPTLVHHDHKWWLFCTSQEAPREQLHLFYADQLEGPYHAHELNPVLTDIRSARPAGTPFVKDGQLYRPTQNCSKTYGGSVIIKQIETLSPTAFQEKFVKEIFPPSKGKYTKALHTLSTFGDKILVDGKRFTFDFYHFKTQLKIKLNRKSP